MLHGAFLLYLGHIHNRQSLLGDLEADIVTREGQTVDPVGLSLVGRSGIVGQNTDGSLLLEEYLELYAEYYDAEADDNETLEMLGHYLENKINDFFDAYPGMDGIILTLHETKVPLLKLKNQKN